MISRLALSVSLATVFTIGGGLPKIDASEPPPPLSFYAMTELKAGANGHFITQASINNRNVTVLVDTGASTVALSYEDADRVGLHPGTLNFNIPVATANGTGKAAKVTLDRVDVNGVRVDNVDAVVLSRGAIQGTLLGMSYLSKLSSFKSENGVLYLKK